MSILEELRSNRMSSSIPNEVGFIAIRPNIKKTMESLQENTVVHKENEWAGQIEKNMPYLYKHGSIQGLLGYGRDKTCIMCGASPALKNNVQYLKDIEGEYRKHFILFAVNSVTEYLLQNDIIPDFVVAVDCDEFLWDRDFSKFNREDLTLLCSPFLHPKIIKNWKGKMMFIPMGCSDEKVQKKVCDVLGSTMPIPGCGNAFNEAVYIAHMIMHCRNYIFVGSELSWNVDGGDKYYVDDKESWDEDDDQIKKFDYPDIYGRRVKTTAGHWVFKTWIEDLASKSDGVYINATEAGILGVTPEDGRLPWIKQMYLKGAIALIKKIVDDAKDWRFVEIAKYNLAWNDGYMVSGLPFMDEVQKLGAKKILDVGCGDGTGVSLLNWFGYDAYGIDIAPLAASRWNGVCDKCDLSFADDIWAEDNWFDLATTDILEHVPTDHVRGTIKEIARVSKHQMFYLDYKPSEYLIRGNVQPHCTIRPPKWWRKEFRRCGLEIVSTPGHRTFITRRKS